MISRGDRCNISTLHGMPSQHRDASNAAGSSTPSLDTTWKRKPTPIIPPRNLDTRSAVPSSPYSFTRSPGNPTANQRFLTQSERPAKKQKTRHDARASGELVFAKGNPHLSSTSKPRIVQEVIEVDEDDGGRGASDDPLDIVGVMDDDRPSPPSSHKLTSKKSRRSASPTQKASTKDHAWLGEFRMRQHGEATKSLGRKVSKHSEPEEESSIGEFTSPVPEAIEQLPHALGKLPPLELVERPVGLVQQYVAIYNLKDNRQLPPPRIDLRDKQHNSTIKQMKMKVNPLKSNERDTLSAPSFPSQNSSSDTKHPTATSLPLKFRVLGLERKEGVFFHWEKPDRVGFSQRGQKVTEFSLDLRSEVGSAEYMPLDWADNESPILALQTEKCTKRQNRNAGHFAFGDKRCGKVVLVFDRAHADWDDAAYDALVAFIKRCVTKSFAIRPSAARSILEAVERGVTNAADYLSLGKRQSIQSSRPPKHPSPGERPSDECRPSSVEVVNTSFSRGASVSTSRSTSRAVPNTISTDLATFPERRSSRQQALVEKRTPPEDLEEVILCFPQGVPGAVNITVGDMKRLEPGEFLNDTLIEFGLKLWLRRLEERNPKLANQIHVFSSFFYKKLNKKNIDEGYDSVRKWTSKFDIFTKKYIIVPINENLHWYLVVIYHPEHVLRSPPPLDSPSTRTRRNAIAVESSLRPLPVNAGTPSINGALAIDTENRFSAREYSKMDAESSSNNEHESNIHRITSANQSPSPTVLSTSTSSRASSDPPDGNKHDALTSEIDEVDQFLTNNVGSCSLDGAAFTVTRTYQSPTPSVAGVGDVEDPSSFMEVDEDYPVNQYQRGSSPTVSEMGKSFTTNRLPSPPQDVEMEQAEVGSFGRLNHSGDIDSLLADEGHAVDPDRFYRPPPKKIYGNQKAAPVVPEDISVGPGEDQQQGELEEEENIVPESALERTTYIFTLDSLGSRHPQAIKQLTNYLEKEAKDKKAVMMTSKATGRQAIVPVQPNYCDCGLYLLHLAETFMTAPDKYCNLILSGKGRKTSQAERQQQWHGAKVQDLRDKLTTEIMQLSKEWKGAKEEAKKKEEGEGKVVETVESSDDEVDIVEHTPAVVPDKATRGKVGKGKGPAPRPTPLRLRGR